MTARITRLDIDGRQVPVIALMLESRYQSFDTRANRALHGTVTGESMAEWGPHYIRHAKGVLAIASTGGQLWERVAE